MKYGKVGKEKPITNKFYLSKQTPKKNIISIESIR
jgi:hypothetical protein